MSKEDKIRFSFLLIVTVSRSEKTMLTGDPVEHLDTVRSLPVSDGIFASQVENTHNQIGFRPFGGCSVPEFTGLLAGFITQFMRNRPDPFLRFGGEACLAVDYPADRGDTYSGLTGDISYRDASDFFHIIGQNVLVKRFHDMLIIWTCSA